MSTPSHYLKLLFSTFPQQSGDLAAQVEAHAMALDGHDLRDIKAAVERFIRGSVSDHNPNFAPSAPLLGKVVRQCMNDRLDHERRTNPPRMIEHHEVEKSLPESGRAAFVKRELARAGVMLPDKRSPDAMKPFKYGRDPDMSAEAVSRRLGYSVGDPEGDEAAA